MGFLGLADWMGSIIRLMIFFIGSYIRHITLQMLIPVICVLNVRCMKHEASNCSLIFQFNLMLLTWSLYFLRTSVFTGWQFVRNLVRKLLQPKFIITASAAYINSWMILRILFRCNKLTRCVHLSLYSSIQIKMAEKICGSMRCCLPL